MKRQMWQNNNELARVIASGKEYNQEQREVNENDHM